MRSKAKIFTGVFLVAILCRLLALTTLLPKLNPDVDLDSYRSLARNLAAGRGFVATDPAGRTLPNVSRTPVYPLFLAALMRIGGDRLTLFLAVQCVLGAITCGLTVMLASRWLPPAGAALAGLLVAIDPNSIVRCVDLRTETLFTLLLIAGACALVVRRRPAWGWAAGGLLWSLAALCRPIAVWLWVVALAVALTLRVPWSQRLRCLALFLLACLPLEASWATRNQSLTGRLFISTIASYNLLAYRAAGVEAARTHQPLDRVQQRLLAECGDIQFVKDRPTFNDNWQTCRHTAAAILRANALTAAKQTTVGWLKVLFGPGARSLDSSSREPDRPARWWPPLYALGLIILTGLALVGTLKLRREAVVPAAVALYLVVLAGGPEANSRFRLPVTPLLAILAVASVRTCPSGHAKAFGDTRQSRHGWRSAPSSSR